MTGGPSILNIPFLTPMSTVAMVEICSKHPDSGCLMHIFTIAGNKRHFQTSSHSTFLSSNFFFFNFRKKKFLKSSESYPKKIHRNQTKKNILATFFTFQIDHISKTKNRKIVFFWIFILLNSYMMGYILRRIKNKKKTVFRFLVFEIWSI